MSAERDAYAVLCVPSHATREEISRAYRALARRFHPDGASPNHGRMAEINRAYDQLKTPDARVRYDADRRGGVAVGPGRPASTTSPWPGTTPPTTSSRRGTGGLASRMAARKAAGEDCTTIDFGRYAGWRLVDLARSDPDYLRWLSRHSSGIRYRDLIAQLLPADRDLGRRASVLG
jgi:curved DNA-binding protein CbpA